MCILLYKIIETSILWFFSELWGLAKHHWALFDGTNFPKRNKEVHAVLKVLDLDYALYEDKTVNPSISTENHNEQLREYNSKLEKWQKSNEFAKLVIKHWISDAIRGASISLYEGW